MEKLLTDIKACTVCANSLALGPRPVLHVSPESKILIVGQAPGTKVHKSGIPWDDQSGKRLRQWLDVDNDSFYDTANFGIVPMGFCYPGKGKSGDLPPRKECAPLWHQPLLDKLPKLELTLLIGQYAQNYYLQDQAQRTLTATVQNYRDYLPNYFVLPHPSPRNGIWLKKNEWFDKEVIPELKLIVASILNK